MTLYVLSAPGEHQLGQLIDPFLGGQAECSNYGHQLRLGGLMSALAVDDNAALNCVYTASGAARRSAA